MTYNIGDKLSSWLSKIWLNLVKVERLKLIKQLTKEIRNPTECYFTFYLLYLLEFIFLRKEKDLSVFGLWSVNVLEAFPVSKNLNLKELVGAETPSGLIKRLSTVFNSINHEGKGEREGRERVEVKVKHYRIQIILADFC